jgi:hypothetical protein
MGTRGRGGGAPGPSRALATALLTALLALAGCAHSSEIVPPEPAATTQRLLYRALERALADLDISSFVGHRVTLSVITQAKDVEFARRFVSAALRERGVHVVPTNAEVDLEVFAHTFGVDRGQTLLGLPALQVPVLGVPTPEIALFKWARHRGRADLQVYAYQPATQEFVRKTMLSTGTSKQDDYTVLLFITFTVTDLEELPH